MRYLLFSTLLFLQIILASECTLRRPQCFDYKVMQKVIENGWKASNTWAKKYIEENATAYMKTFMQEVKKPIRIKTDEEYIEDALKEHHKYIDQNITSETIKEYKERLEEEVKHKVYYLRFINNLSGELFQIPYLYIKYLEDTNKTKEAFEIYKSIANYFLDIHKKQNYGMLSIFIELHNHKLFVKALSSSILHYSYTEKQKQELYSILIQFLLDKKVFSNMLKGEKNLLFTYLSIHYLNAKNANQIIKKKVIFKKMLAAVDEKNLKSHLNNHSTLQKMVKQYKNHINKIFQKITSFNTLSEYRTYDKEMREVEHYLGKIEILKFGSLVAMEELKLDFLNQLLKYNLNEEEFIHLSVSLLLLYDKPWILGKNKFEIEEQYEKNKKLLELLK